MKSLKNFAMMVIVVAVAAIASSCNDGKEKISVNSTSLSFDVRGGDITLSISSDGIWLADSPDWVTVSPSSCSVGRDVTVTAPNNYSTDGSESREGIITFYLYSGDGTVEIPVSQAGNSPATVLLSENFDFLMPYAESVNQADCVGYNTTTGFVQTEARIDNVIVNDVSAQTDLNNRGYVVEASNGRVSTSGGNEYTFVMPGYLYFGNSTSQAGIHLPKISNIPSGEDIWMDFYWCPGTSSSMVVDDVTITAVFTDGGDVQEIEIPEHNLVRALEWIPVSINLAENGITLTSTMDIFLRPKDEQWGDGDKHRWFLGDINIYVPGK